MVDVTPESAMSSSALLTRRVANPLLRVVLSSPLHRPLSRTLLVLSYVGWRSGRHRATPVQFARFGDDLALVAARASHKSWWRNFRDPAPATITLRGRRQRAIAEVLRGNERNAGLSAFRARYPRARLEDDFEVVRVRVENATDSAAPGSL
jgi:deazaflavin-dependent oxidoreductase (nitroreductase family)